MTACIGSFSEDTAAFCDDQLDRPNIYTALRLGLCGLQWKNSAGSIQLGLHVFYTDATFYSGIKCDAHDHIAQTH